jgi:UDP-N-acetylglucosamine diphosphorylase/glucosamine-1-phosphate N-acetyltransferase
MTIGSFTRRLSVVIMAAGKGTRMNSDLPKVLHSLNHRPMIAYVVDAARSLKPSNLIAVIGYQKDKVMESIGAEDITFAFQDDPQGTGHAALQTEHALDGFEGDIMILSGDVPLLTTEVLKDYLNHHRKSGVWLTLLTAEVDDPTGYGRIVRDETGLVTAIVEHKDADEETRKIKEYNSGIYLVQHDELFDRLHRIDNDNAKGEYYITDIVKIALEDGCRISAHKIDDANLVKGINTASELTEAELVLKKRNAKKSVKK